MKRIKIFLLLLLLSVPEVLATHYMGGEITWECLANGRYRFIMKLYRECGTSVNYYTTETINVSNYLPPTSITMTLRPGSNPMDGLDGALDGKTDISPNCFDPNQEIKCYPQPTLSNTGAIEEWYFTSDAVYPNGVLLSGTPPAAGWIFSHSDCCRNPSTNMVDPTNYNWYLRAIMYSFQGQPAFPCFDNSPVFAEIPSTVICTGYPFRYNHNATDKELDSLSFAWAPAMQSVTLQMGYTPGYSFLSPLPGTAQNPSNIPATMNPYNGEISYTSYTNGAFVTVTKVTAYRCGIKIAEIFREMQIVLLACPGNNVPPDIPGPFYNPVSGIYEYTDTVYAGDVVDFDITIIDNGTLPNGLPQTVTLEASGQEFGTNYTSTTGCVRPPCATLNPPPIISAMYAVATHFHWQTSCDHLTHPVSITGIPGICGTLFNVHNFIIKAYDNNCPAPGIRIATISIVVLPLAVLEPPELKCTKVHDNGDITLNWIPPPDPLNTFNSYHVYYSDSPTGPFVVIDSIFDYNVTSKTYSGLGGNSGQRYFYINTRSGCYGKYFSETNSDTLSTIFLEVTTGGGGEIANITWNPIHEPLPVTSSQWYHIYREYPPGSWNLLDSTTALNYQDTVNICSAFINYRIEISDATGCISVSSVDGENLHDGFPPTLPLLDSVSVDLISGKAVLGWSPSVSADVVKYYIYHKMGAPWYLIDSVDVPQTQYVHLSPSPSDSSVSYRIAAVDSCKKLSQMGLEHKTIYLSPLILNACADKIRLEWTPYINFHPILDGYTIFVSENGSPYTELANVPPTITSFEHIGLNNNSTYCYYIRAFTLNNQKTSSSNTQCALVTKPNPPKYVYLRYATVVNDDYIRIGFFVDTTAYVTMYKVLRSSDGLNYDTIALIPPNNVYANVSYNDMSGDVHQSSYYYKVVVTDSCDLDALESNVGKTIFINGNADDYLYNYIYWSHYEDRLPQAYNIIREVEDYEPFTKIQTLSSSETTMTDDVESYTESSGRFRYYVEATLYDVYDSTFIFYDTVHSNYVLLLQSPRLYMPNAFCPDGINNIIKPIGVFTDKDDYSFIIYNRWGQKLFETADYNVGWDGTFNGDKCEFGIYTYYIKITSAQNKSFVKRGIITLVR